MPSDSEHHMDKPLRAYARKRREDAGEPVLHPATRRLLQTEVAQLRANPPALRRQWTWLAWPRLAFASAAAVILGVLLWNFLPDQRNRASNQTLAYLDKAEVEQKAKSAQAKVETGALSTEAELKDSLQDERLAEKTPSTRFRDGAD